MSISSDGGPGDIGHGYIRAYGVHGNHHWTSAPGEDLSYFFDLAVGPWGIYAIGWPIGNFSVFVQKYTFTGGMAWSRSFGTGGFQSATEVAVDTTGMYVVGHISDALPTQTSAGSQDVFLLRYDFDANAFGLTSSAVQAAMAQLA
jgi:hypothetical protein